MKTITTAFALLATLCLAGSALAQEQVDSTPQQFISAEEMLIQGGTPGVGIEFITVHGRAQFDKKSLVKRSFLPEIQEEARLSKTDAQ